MKKKHQRNAAAETLERGDVRDKLRSIWLIGLMIMLVATPMVPSESATTSGYCVPFILVTLLLAMGWVWGMLMTRSWDLHLGWSGLGMCLFVAWAGVSTVFMHTEGQPRQTIAAFWQWASLGAIFVVARNLIRFESERRAVLAVMIAFAATLSAFSFYQVKVAMPEAVREYEANPDGVVAKMGIDAPLGSPQREQLENRLRSTEPYATFSLANSLAGFLAPWFLVSVGVTWVIVRSRQFGRHSVYVMFAVVAMILLCLVLTKSRTAWLATIVAGALMIVYGRQRGWRPDWRVVTAVVGFVFLSVAVGIVIGNLDWLVLSESSKSITYRLEYWRATAAMITEHPWFGCGPGNFQQYYTQYKLPQSSETVADPHNFMFEVWATLGTPGLVALVGVFVGLFLDARTSQRHAARAIDDQTVVAEADDGAPNVIYLGGILGFLFAYPLGLMAGFMPLLELVPIGAVVGGIVLWALKDWVRHGDLPRFVTSAALVGLLINLFSAGGISFAGISQSVWLLAAVTVPLSRPQPIVPRDTKSLVVPVASFIITFLMVLGFWWTEYYPHQYREQDMGDATLFLKLGRLDQAMDASLAAAEVDPQSFEPHQRLAYMNHQLWISAGQKGRRSHFEEHERRNLELNRRSYQAFLEAGGWWLAAYRVTDDFECLQRATDRYRTAVRLYPNSGYAHGQLAWVCHLATKDDSLQQEAKNEAAEALRLDNLNPHKEQKLGVQKLVDFPELASKNQSIPPTGTAEAVLTKLLAN